MVTLNNYDNADQVISPDDLKLSEQHGSERLNTQAEIAEAQVKDISVHRRAAGGGLDQFFEGFEHQTWNEETPWELSKQVNARVMEIVGQSATDYQASLGGSSAANLEKQLLAYTSDDVLASIKNIRTSGIHSLQTIETLKHFTTKAMAEAQGQRTDMESKQKETIAKRGWWSRVGHKALTIGTLGGYHLVRTEQRQKWFNKALEKAMSKQFDKINQNITKLEERSGKRIAPMQSRILRTLRSTVNPAEKAAYKTELIDALQHDGALSGVNLSVKWDITDEQEKVDFLEAAKNLDFVKKDLGVIGVSRSKEKQQKEVVESAQKQQEVMLDPIGFESVRNKLKVDGMKEGESAPSTSNLVESITTDLSSNGIATEDIFGGDIKKADLLTDTVRLAKLVNYVDAMSDDDRRKKLQIKTQQDLFSWIDKQDLDTGKALDKKRYDKKAEVVVQETKVKDLFVDIEGIFTAVKGRKPEDDKGDFDSDINLANEFSNKFFIGKQSFDDFKAKEGDKISDADKLALEDYWTKLEEVRAYLLKLTVANRKNRDDFEQVSEKEKSLKESMDKLKSKLSAEKSKGTRNKGTITKIENRLLAKEVELKKLEKKQEQEKHSASSFKSSVGSLENDLRDATKVYNDHKKREGDYKRVASMMDNTSREIEAANTRIDSIKSRKEAAGGEAGEISELKVALEGARKKSSSLDKEVIEKKEKVRLGKEFEEETKKKELLIEDLDKQEKRSKEVDSLGEKKVTLGGLEKELGNKREVKGLHEELVKEKEANGSLNSERRKKITALQKSVDFGKKKEDLKQAKVNLEKKEVEKREATTRISTLTEEKNLLAVDFGKLEKIISGEIKEGFTTQKGQEIDPENVEEAEKILEEIRLEQEGIDTKLEEAGKVGEEFEKLSKEVERSKKAYNEALRTVTSDKVLSENKKVLDKSNERLKTLETQIGEKGGFVKGDLEAAEEAFKKAGDEVKELERKVSKSVKSHKDDVEVAKQELEKSTKEVERLEGLVSGAGEKVSGTDLAKLEQEFVASNEEVTRLEQQVRSKEDGLANELNTENKKLRALEQKLAEDRSRNYNYVDGIADLEEAEEEKKRIKAKHEEEVDNYKKAISDIKTYEGEAEAKELEISAEKEKEKKAKEEFEKLKVSELENDLKSAEDAYNDFRLKGRAGLKFSPEEQVKMNGLFEALKAKTIEWKEDDVALGLGSMDERIAQSLRVNDFAKELDDKFVKQLEKNDQFDQLRGASKGTKVKITYKRTSATSLRFPYELSGTADDNFIIMESNDNGVMLEKVGGGESITILGAAAKGGAAYKNAKIATTSGSRTVNDPTVGGAWESAIAYNFKIAA